MGIAAGYTAASMATFGENVARQRKARRLSQAELAERLRMRQPSLSKIENQKDAEVRTALKLASALGCSVDDLVAGIDPHYDEAARARADATHDHEKSSAESGNRVTSPVTPSDNLTSIPGGPNTGETREEESPYSHANSARPGNPLWIASRLRETAAQLSALADNCLHHAAGRQDLSTRPRETRALSHPAGVPRTGARRRSHR